MTKTRMMYIAVLVVGIVVLVWDKNYSTHSSSNPSTATAQETKISGYSRSRPTRPVIATNGHLQGKDGTSSSAAFSDVSANAMGSVQNDTDSNNDINKSSKNNTIARDIFSPVLAFSVASESDSGNLKGNQKSSIPLRLISTVIKQPNSYAMVNDKMYQEGDYIGKYQIKKILTDRIILTCDSEDITLSLASKLLSKKELDTTEDSISADLVPRSTGAIQEDKTGVPDKPGVMTKIRQLAIPTPDNSQ